MTTKHIQEIAENPKDFLNRCYRGEEKIAAIKARIAHWREHAVSLTLTLKPVVSYSMSPSKKIEECVCNIIDLQAELEKEISWAILLQRDASDAIRQFVSDPNWQTLLELRYLNYLHWEEIAVILKFSYRWTLRLHGLALSEMQKKASNLVAV